ncbi:MFS general substrate transporter [Armillaria solidipes]|uniref:MFS general substrate transporter n=1 Tax=Armillaria solidipes TaxID=1076256 RepID=A0A2H3AYJ1_9AGAR|nr:MFS general substrate transporter [Armillaria solidipes]
MLDDVPLATASAEYTPQQYKKLKRKVDYYLLPLLWLCCQLLLRITLCVPFYPLPDGLQDADRAVLSPMSVFRLREDTGLVGQQYSWSVCHLPMMQNVIRRWRMGKTLSVFMMCMGIVMLCIGFAKDFAQLVALRFLLGIFQCCIGSGFILIIGCWYTRNEHSSRSLVFLSSGVGVGSIIDLILYGIGTLEYRSKDIQAWRYMAYFLGSLTIFVGIVCFHFLGSPSEVSWLTKEEKRMANARILENQSGHDRTGISAWKWYQARECLTDPCFYFTAIVVFLTAVPGAGFSAFRSIIDTGFGFTPLQGILFHIPENMASLVVYFLAGFAATKWNNLRLYLMALSLIPGFIGVLGMALVEANESNKVVDKMGDLLGSISSHYCAGSMCGSQIFRQKDAPTYKPGLIRCGVCFAIELLVTIAWRATLVLRNRRRVKATLTDGLTQEERLMQGKINGESDMTDFENPHFRYTL